MTPDQSEEMCKALAKVLAWDDRFFKQRPDRRHRIRRAYPAEIAFHQWRGFLSKAVPDSLRIYVGKSVTDATKCAVGFGISDLETDLSEEDAAWLFAILKGHDTLSPSSYAAHASAAPSSSRTRGRIE